MNFSILIVTFKRKILLKSCLDSLQLALTTTKPNQYIELLVVLNGEDEESESFLNSYQPTKNLMYSWKKLSQRTPAAARNYGLTLLKGDWFIFFDDDIEVPHDYFIKAEYLLKQFPESNVLGGPDQTPLHSNHFSKVLGEVLKSPMATAITRMRHNIENGQGHWADEKSFILCNLWIKSEFYLKSCFHFDERLYRNEENVLLFQIQKKSSYLLWHPDLWVYHHRRSKLRELIRPIFYSGRCRMKSFFLYPESFNIIYLIPSFFVIYLLILPFFALSLFQGILLSYFVTLFYFSVEIFKKSKRLSDFFWSFFLHFLINITYGIGTISSFFDPQNLLRFLSKSFWKNIPKHWPVN